MRPSSATLLAEQGTGGRAEGGEGGRGALPSSSCSVRYRHEWQPRATIHTRSQLAFLCGPAALQHCNQLSLLPRLAGRALSHLAAVWV